jgi:type IV pilus assembly protein PilE
MQRQSGFTLIELMVTVAIVAILAAIAIPNYTDYIRRSKIQEATTALLAMRTKMEQYYQDNRFYSPPVGSPVVAPCQAGSSVPIPTGLKYFNITCPVIGANPPDYTIQADAIDSGVAGITFTIDVGNVRATTVAAGSAMDQAGYAANPACWTARKGGQC